MKKNLIKLIILFGIIVHLLSPGSTFAQLTFSRSYGFHTASEPLDLVTADFNGDGKPDMAVSSIHSNTVSVFLNTTVLNSQTPDFTGAVNLSTGISTSPFGIRASDFNEDGKIDILVATGFSNFCILLNTTPTGSLAPSFSSPKYFITPSNLSDKVDFADFNCDGKPDIVIPCNSLDSIAVLMNTTVSGAAEPSFSTATVLPAGDNPTTCQTGDINNDGRPDFVVGYFNKNFIWVYINNTTVGASVPSFSSQIINFPAPYSPYKVSIADLNLDGKADLVTANTFPRNVSVFLNNTSPGVSPASFSARTDLEGVYANWVIAKDINGDNIPDVISGGDGDSTISVFMNTTSPGATTPSFFSRQDVPVSVSTCFGGELADFNGDGAKDLAYVNTYVQDSVSVKLNLTELGNTTFSFGAKTNFNTVSSPQKTCVADFNLDGKPDIATFTGNIAPHVVSIGINNITPGAGTPSFNTTDVTVSSAPSQNLLAVDLNCDNKPDLIYNETIGFAIYFKMNTTTPGAATPTFGAEDAKVVLSHAEKFCTGDFNLDGKTDLAYSDNTFSRVYVMFNTTAPGATSPTFSSEVHFSSTSNVSDMYSADVNGDGKQDLIFGGIQCGVMLNTFVPGGLTPSFSSFTQFDPGGTSKGLTVSDFNGDGKPDFATGCYNDSSVSVVFNTTPAGSSTATFGSYVKFNSGQMPRSLSSIDFNGDGKTDIVSANEISGTNSVFINTTTPGSVTPSFAPKLDLTAETSPYSVCTGDVNMDGKPDIITTNHASHSVSVFLNSTIIPLPVELLSFTSYIGKIEVTLKWSTASEVNNRGFDIERKSDGNWEKIGFVMGSGNTNAQQNYSYSDRGLKTGKYNYRLKQIDYNGNFKYFELSNTVIIGVPERYSLAQNYPNPFNPRSLINFQLPSSSFVSLKVYDISGREISSLVNEIKEAGYYTVQFDGTNFSSGVYFYKMQANDFVSVKKMILVK